MNCIINSKLAIGSLAVGVVGLGFLALPFLRNVATVMNPCRLKMVFVVRSDLGMGKGKIASQCAHAAIQCYKVGVKSQEKVVAHWLQFGQPKIVLKISSESELELLHQKAITSGLTSYIVRDAGKTQLDAGTATVLGIGPGDKKLLDSITGHLKLL